MSAQPVHEEPDPRDPQAIHDRLPERFRAGFLAEYHTAVEAAHTFAGYRELQNMLHVWHLRAITYSDPGYDEVLAEVREGRGEYFTLEQVMEQYAAHNAR